MQVDCEIYICFYENIHRLDIGAMKSETESSSWWNITKIQIDGATQSAMMANSQGNDPVQQKKILAFCEEMERNVKKSSSKIK